MKQKPFRISIGAISAFLFLLAAMTMLLSVREVYKVNRGVQEEARLQNIRQECENQGIALAEGSDYLTDEVWRFIATGETEHLEHYWVEVNETKSREKALEALAGFSPSSEEIAFMEAAKRSSDELINGEAWAMRLAAQALGLPPESLPAEVAAVELTPEELALSSDRQRQMAMEYIFGLDYKEKKVEIKSSIEAFQMSLRGRMNEELDAATDRTRRALINAQVLNVIMLLFLLLTMAMIYVMVTRPFREYARELREMEGSGFSPLKVKGSKDTARFAEAYNRIYEDWKQQSDQLKEEQFRFHVAIENTPMIIFEYAVDMDEYKAYGLLDGRAPDDPMTKDTPIERVIPNYLRSKAAGIVGESGIPAIQKLIDGEGGTQELPVLFNGATIWGRITATPIYNQDHRFVKLIGKITNIDSEREKELALEEMRSRDSLTGVYNKEVGVRLVQEYIVQKSPDEICSLMLLDMDDFARLNDTEGTVFADAVLMETADTLKSMVAPGDLVVRLGGDEFMLFLKNCPKSRAEVLGSQIADAIHKLTPMDASRPAVSASIGICTTRVMSEYSGLYRYTENTLKYVKEHGKGKAICYLEAVNELGTALALIYPEGYSLTQIDRSESSQEDLVSFALDLLGKSKNLNDAIYLLLSRVGKLLDLARITIIEVDTEYLTCRVTQQWVKNRADSQIGEVYDISGEELHAVEESYDADGLSTKYEIHNLQGIGSILHAAIWNRGVYDGIMSFERREIDYSWTADERRALSELNKIITSFTLRARADAVSQAKTEFLSRMSHEIRTPMNAITGMTAIAKASLGDLEKTEKCLDTIESANAYLLALINDVLDMSRIESGKIEIHLEPVNPASQLGNLDDLMRPQAEEKELRFTVENHVRKNLWVMADPLRINQVLINLLGNAVKFTKSGGSIALKIESREENDREAALRFCVADNGIGIEAEAQKRIFNAFEQASSNTAYTYGGTGLGLAISSRLVQMMGGVLEVKSEPGKGSEFFFILPVARTNAPGDAGSHSKTRAEDEAAYVAKGRRILLVEDNEINREIAHEILSMNGYQVETAVDGSEAVQSFQNHPPGYFDAILMDIRMPVMDGFEATRRIRTMGKDDSRTISILAMTANAFDEDMKQSIASGMNGHLSKPIEVDKLLTMLRQCILFGRSQENQTDKGGNEE